MFVPVSKIEIPRFMMSCRALYEELKLRCGAEQSSEFSLVPKLTSVGAVGLSYRVCPLAAFGKFKDTSRTRLALVLYECETKTPNWGSAHIGVISPIPDPESYVLETLEFKALVYVRVAYTMATHKRHDMGGYTEDQYEIGATVRRNAEGLSLLEMQDCRDLICFVEDHMCDAMRASLEKPAFGVER